MDALRRTCYKFIAEALWQKVKAKLLGQAQFSYFQTAEEGKPVPWAKLMADRILEVAKKLLKPTATSRMGQVLFLLFGPDSEPVVPGSYVELEESTKDDSHKASKEEEFVEISSSTPDVYPG